MHMRYDKEKEKPDSNLHEEVNKRTPKMQS